MPNGLKLSHLFLYCALPFHYEPYVGCDHGCSYCYVTSTHSTFGCRKAKINSVTEAIQYLERSIKGKSDERFISTLRRGIALRLGVLGDPFQAIEDTYKMTDSILDWAEDRNYPITIATKGATVALGYAEKLANPNVHLQVSIATINDSEAKRIEPNTPSPSDRLKLIEEVSKRGGFVTVRLAPMIPWLSSGTKKDEFVQTVASSGAKHLMVEHLKLPKKQIVPLSKALGLNIKKLFSHGNTRGHTRELDVSRRVLGAIEFRDLAHLNGMSYGCGDNDLKLLNDSVCCCGTDLALGTEKVNPAMMMRATLIAREKGSVCWEDIESDWIPDGSIDMNKTVVRKLARIRKSFALRESAWKYGGLGQYGLKKSSDGYELDRSVKYIDRILTGRQ